MKRIIFGLLAITNIYLIFPFRSHGETDRHAHARRDTVSITDYGAVPDGRSDSTAAIKAAITAAKFRGLSVFVPPGTFSHRSFSLDGISMSGVGPASILLAPNPEDGTIFLRRSGLALRDMTVKVKSSHRDSRNPAIWIDSAERFEIGSVTVDGGNAGGIFDSGGRNGSIVHNTVRNTLADAIHNTNGAHEIVIAGNTVRHAGDDMIAVVSYMGESISHNILIADNDLADQQNGRGISVVGGQDVTIQGNTVARTDCCAGIYLASEKAWKTQSVRNILVRDNILTDNSGSTGHGAIMIFADGGSVRDIRLERNTIIDARHAAVTLLGAVRNIALIDNRFANPAEGSITGDGSNVYCKGNTVGGLPVLATPCGSPENFTVMGSSLSSKWQGESR